MIPEPTRAHEVDGRAEGDELRARLRDERRRRPAGEAQSAADAVAATVRRRPWMRPDATVAAYDPIDGELSPAALRGPWFEGRWCLPRIEGDRLDFVPDDGNGRPHRWGMHEPAGQPLELDALDVCLVPLVGATLRCDRLGMGGGFYDRTFAPLRCRGGVSRPILVGVAYDFQIVDFAPHARDVPLDEVVTPTRVLMRWSTAVE